MKKSAKDCLLVLVWKFKYNVRLAVQLADSQGEIIFYVGFQRHMLRWMENLSSYVTCVQIETSTRQGRV
jgi:hypothetical protein